MVLTLSTRFSPGITDYIVILVFTIDDFIQTPQKKKKKAAKAPRVASLEKEVMGNEPAHETGQNSISNDEPNNGARRAEADWVVTPFLSEDTTSLKNRLLQVLLIEEKEDFYKGNNI